MCFVGGRKYYIKWKRMETEIIIIIICVVCVVQSFSELTIFYRRLTVNKVDVQSSWLFIITFCRIVFFFFFEKE